MRIRFWFLTLIVLFICFLTSCSGNIDESTRSDSSGTINRENYSYDDVLYHVEKADPLGLDNNENIPSDTSKANIISNRTDFFFYKDNVSYLLTITDNDEESIYLCSYGTDRSEVQFKKLRGDFPMSVISCEVFSDGELYLLVRDNEDSQWVAKLYEDEISLIFKVDSSFECLLFYGDGKELFWLYDSHSSVVRMVDKTGKTLNENRKENRICDICFDDHNGKVVLVENHDGNIVLDADGDFSDNTSDKTKISPFGAIIDFSNDGTPFICQTDHIYSGFITIFDFALNDRILSKVYDFKTTESGFELIASIDDYLYHIIVEEGAPKSDKKEIVLATGFVKINLQKAVADFNRSNTDYHVTIHQMEDILYSVGDLYFNTIHKQLAEGEGPDIVTNDVVTNLSDFVNSGYLVPLDIDFDRDDFVGNIFQTLYYNNDLYGFPYDFQLKTVVSNDQLFKGKNTPDEFMNNVRNSGADILECGKTGEYIVLDYFLSDTTNTDYIDWENGVSHLTEDPFLKVIEFAKEFEDCEYQNDGSTPYEAEYVKSGKALFKQLEIDDIYTDINSVKALFGSEYLYMVYPSVNGNVTVIESSSLYLSSFSKEKEGALQFIQYCASLQHQDAIAYWTSPEKGYFGIRPKLPIMQKSFDSMIEKKRHNEYEIYHSDSNGLKYKAVDLDEEDISKFRNVVEKASGRNGIPDEVRDMIEEELSYYFEGICTAQEAAEALDSRITVYLNEKK